MDAENGVAVVTAAQNGDHRAQDELVGECLPLVYNIVGRALNGHADVDDVVQETMLRVINGLDSLRDPADFRSWLVAIAMNQIRQHWRENHSRTAPLPGYDGLDDSLDIADPGADFVDATLTRLGLEGQRRELVQASRWLDSDDTALMSLWWLEAAGELTRAEVAAALELSPQHVGVRVQRMKGQLETARVVVRALDSTRKADPRACAELESMAERWDGAPSPLWRKRFSRHVRACASCSGHREELAPAEKLLVNLTLAPMTGTAAAALLETVCAKADAGEAAARPAGGMTLLPAAEAGSFAGAAGPRTAPAPVRAGHRRGTGSRHRHGRHRIPHGRRAGRTTGTTALPASLAGTAHPADRGRRRRPCAPRPAVALPSGHAASPAGQLVCTSGQSREETFRPAGRRPARPRANQDRPATAAHRPDAPAGGTAPPGGPAHPRFHDPTDPDGTGPAERITAAVSSRSAPADNTALRRPGPVRATSARKNGTEHRPPRAHPRLYGRPEPASPAGRRGPCRTQHVTTQLTRFR
ncbi:RNA polymerase sigma factor [Streptomyces lydicus]|uniref:RNA polymerase sigma factor n=1 Tax=Streptomyces lydicus TaxID=47763 RepID=UPI002870773E|nr:sigma-70 family RNA polymerase sigma factor [Streptomyces lydicus]